MKKKRHYERSSQSTGGGAWPFLVDVVLCLVHPVNDRVFSMLNRVKYDCSLISFSASWAVNSFFNFCELFNPWSYSLQFHFLKFVVMQLQFLNLPKLLSYAATDFFVPELILHKNSVEG